MDLAVHYASADLFLFPSLTETFGNVTAEAMASALPVVAYDYAAAAQLIEPGLSGMLVARGNEAQFERCALSLASSRATRLAMGMRARVRARQHDWPAVVMQFERVLSGVLHGTSSMVSARSTQEI
jgi:glycosyltransferase involved in cell wall biosynthesis